MSDLDVDDWAVSSDVRRRSLYREASHVVLSLLSLMLTE